MSAPSFCTRLANHLWCRMRGSRGRASHLSCLSPAGVLVWPSGFDRHLKLVPVRAVRGNSAPTSYNHPGEARGGGKFEIQSTVLPFVLTKSRLSTTLPRLWPAAPSTVLYRKEGKAASIRRTTGCRPSHEPLSPLDPQRDQGRLRNSTRA